MPKLIERSPECGLELLKTTNAGRARQIELVLEDSGIQHEIRLDDTGTSTIFVQGQDVEKAELAIDEEILDQRSLQWSVDRGANGPPLTESDYPRPVVFGQAGRRTMRSSGVPGGPQWYPSPKPAALRA